MTETPDLAGLHAAALAYCDAVYGAKAEVFETLCHPAFAMTLIGPDGPAHWDKAGYLARVAGRAAAPGAPVYEILGVDISGPMGRVHLTVEIPGARFEDHLGFVHDGGRWQLLTKVFRDITPAD